MISQLNFPRPHMSFDLHFADEIIDPPPPPLYILQINQVW